jgi:hypothetical protein
VTNQRPENQSADGAELPVIAEQHSTRERLTVKGRTCAWCGAWVPYKGSGRPARYCSPAHRQRDYELRTANARAQGERSTDPVREVIERVETRTRTVIRQGPPIVARYERLTLADWLRLLYDLRSEMFPPAAAAELADLCDQAARALRASLPADRPKPPTIPPPRQQPKRRKKRR